LSNSGLDDKPPPLTVNGTPWHAPIVGGPPPEKASEDSPADTKPAAKPRKKGGR
jgi:hypothetical protein